MPLAMDRERAREEKLRLSSRVKKGDRVTLEADASQAPDAVYTMLDQISKSLPLNLYNITQVELTVSMYSGTRKARTAGAVRITPPEFVFAQVRRTGLEAARHAGSLGDRTQGAAGSAGAC